MERSHEQAMEDLIAYMHERERIRLRKEAGEPKPWTEDPILQKFKFTNILRAHDRTTRWGVDNWYVPARKRGVSARIMLLNCGIYRMFGTIGFAQEVGFSTEFDAERLKSVARRMESEGRRVFTSAYVITNGGISAPKREVVSDIFLRNLNQNLDYVLGSQEGLFEKYAKRLYSVQGFGGTGFMAKEVLSDLLLSGVIEDFRDKYEWTPVGPGALRGLGWMFPGVSIPKGEKALPYLRKVADGLQGRLEPWMPQFGQELDLHGVQFAMCEIDKYLRTKIGNDRPKNTYPGR